MNDKKANIDEESTFKDLNFDDLIEYSPETVETQENVREITAFQCTKCDFVDSKQETVQQHQLCHDRSLKTYTEVVVYVCSLCYGQYTSVEDLRGHMIEFHKCKPIKEVNETVKPPSKSKAIELQSKKTPNVVREAEINPLALLPVPFKDFRLILRRNLVLKCSVKGCAYKFEDKEKQAIHLKCHKENSLLEFKCFECGISIENWRRCSVHLWKTHRLSIGLLQCPLCAYVSAATVRIWRHMQTHRNWKSKVLKSIKTKKEEEKPQPAPRNKYYAEKSCDICNRKFVSGKTLSKHVKSVHNKIKPCICNVCGLKTTRKAILVIHMRQHTGEKPLKCKVCKFCTRDPSTLKTHEMRHETVRKQQCPSCDRSFIQTTALKSHIRKNHPEEYKKIACSICTYVTTSVEKLEAHMNDHRNGLIVSNEDSMDPLKNPAKFNAMGKHLGNTEISSDCFLPLESVDSIPHVPAVDTGGVTIPAPAHSEDTQFPTFLNN